MLYKITGRVLHNPLNLRRLCACGVHQVHVVRFIILGLLSAYLIHVLQLLSTSENLCSKNHPTGSRGSSQDTQ